MIEKNIKGLLLAGGYGTRLRPLTSHINKHLLPLYNKPMIYYSLATIMLAGINDIVVVSTKEGISSLKKLLSNGSRLGIKLTYVEQKEAKGIAHGIIQARKFLKGQKVLVNLGDHVLFGNDLSAKLKETIANNRTTLFAYRYPQNKSFGVAKFNKRGYVEKIIEKPNKFVSNYIITGLYFYNDQLLNNLSKIKISNRKEYEITDLNNIYLKNKSAEVEILGRGYCWFDAGTFDNLLDCSIHIRTLEKRQGLRVASLEEISLREKFINIKKFKNIIKTEENSDYKDYLNQILKEYNMNDA